MKKLVVLFVALATAIALAAPAVAGEPIQPQRSAPTPDTPSEWVNESTNLWFVELPSAPRAAGTSRNTLANERRAFRAEAKAARIDFEERYAFERLFNGFSIEIASDQLLRLSQLTSVSAIYPVMEVPMPATGVSGPQLATAIQMTGADVAQSELGFTGEGIKVAVMDTGIDYDHPDLGGCFGAGCRVFTGWDFVGDAYNADPSDPGYNPVPSPDPDPDDCEGHGTHVSGIVGANGTAVGVAPGVTFGAYRVFGCEGSTTSDIMIAAMERALADGMDVLNMSIGSSFTWPQYPTAVASNLLVDAGMVVVASIGNSGASGTFSAGAPGLGEKVIGVAAFENITATFPVAEVDDAETEPTDVGYNPMAYSDEIPTSGTHDIVFVGQGCDADLPLDADPTGKIALIVRGSCSFAEKAQNAQDAGAIATVIHNNESGNFNGTLGSAPAVPQIVVSISGEDGEFIRSLTDPTWTWTDRYAAFPNPGAGLIASFSAYGLSPDLSLKPDIGAPGGNIYSTYPLEQGGYANLGGTSMSSPHVAGAAALLLEARPSTPAQLVRDILQNSADPADWWLAPGAGYIEPVHRQGAGMLDIDDAILQDSVVTPGKLALGESEAGNPVTRQIRITNNSSEEITYSLGAMNLVNSGFAVAPIATTGVVADDPDGIGFWLSAEVASFSKDTVTVKPGKTAQVVVQIAPEAPAPDDGFDNVLYGGWITITPDDGSDVLRVPYAGFIGDYQSYDVMTPGAFGVFPALGWTPDGVNFGLVPPGWVYSMLGFDQPNILLHLHHQSQEMVVKVFTEDGLPVAPAAGDALFEEYLPRNSSDGSFFAFPWDGTILLPGNGGGMSDVPNGRYYFEVSVLKALGNSSNHWETWTSPIFEIARPFAEEESGRAKGPKIK